LDVQGTDQLQSAHETNEKYEKEIFGLHEKLRSAHENSEKLEKEI